jgi:hypothetical protein
MTTGEFNLPRLSPDADIKLHSVKAGIRDRRSGYIVSEHSFPLFLYEGYTADRDNLEKGLFRSKLLVQVSYLGF